MDVKKIFMTLIIVVACVMIGALLLNVLLPNASRALVNAVEGMIFNATGMSFDFNGDTVAGGTNTGDYSGNDNRINDAYDAEVGNGGQVDGFN